MKEKANVSTWDLITRWEDALAAVQHAPTLDKDEFSEEELEAAELPGLGARSGLRAGAQETSLLGGCSGDCTGAHACPG